MTADLPEPVHRGELRVSQADREAVVERLNEAAAEGRIDFTELDARLNQALTATTHADLAPVTADLPPVAASDPGQPLVLDGGDLGAVRAGRWQVPARVSVHGGRGGAKLDFTQATCRLSDVEVEAHGEEAGVTVIIPDGWAVEIGGMELAFSGLKDKTTADRLPGTPLIRLTGTGGSAGVVIRHPNNRERRKLRRDQQH